MLSIRVVKTKSNSRAVQIVKYVQRKTVVVEHIGSAHNEEELNLLKETARSRIDKIVQQQALFPSSESSDNILILNKSKYIGYYYSVLFEVISHLQKSIGYTSLKIPLLNDLVTMRLVEPASKLRSIELMSLYFGVKHQRKEFYKSAKQWLDLKDIIERKTLKFAQKEFGFDFSLVFYDVTTLYFESFESDELRKTGFSKDNKNQQPQILIGLMVNRDGFPLGYEIFTGNTFEGHTILPILQNFIKKHKAENFTVIADAAMISHSNITELRSANINFIVGARLGNVSAAILNTIEHRLIKEDGFTMRVKTEYGYLVCSFSEKRFKKDTYEMEKQIEKAKFLLNHPSKNRKTKFIKTEDEKIILNSALIEKTKKLLGVKGYYTDLHEGIVSNKEVIERYHDLYKIEQAFRISKSDLQARPIFHFKEESIKLHILICFMALAVSKHIEIQTSTSIKAFIAEGKKITDARLYNNITQKEIRLRTEINPKMKAILFKLGMSY